MAKHGLTREVFFCSLASNSLQFLRGEHKRARYDHLPTAAQIGEAAKVRWVIPRAQRMPEFRAWRSNQFLRELDGNDARVKRGRLELAG
jgi:hypothetical protein